MAANVFTPNIELTVIVSMGPLSFSTPPPETSSNNSLHVTSLYPTSRGNGQPALR